MPTFNPGCAWCKNTGWVVATHKEKIGLFGFRCSCAIGTRYAERIPIWGDVYSSEYIPDAEGIALVHRVAPRPPEPKKEPVKFKTDFKAKAAADDWDDEVPF